MQVPVGSTVVKRKLTLLDSSAEPSGLKMRDWKVSVVGTAKTKFEKSSTLKNEIANDDKKLTCVNILLVIGILEQ